MVTKPDLDHWHARLASHFEILAAERHSGSGTPPVFALEHGLAEPEIEAVSRVVRAHVASKTPSWRHRLPWIVYAAELGYRYSGNEYWQTFEAATPGWRDHGDRSWIRKCYSWFQGEYGGATPSGQWANWFTIICWPITHAVLPKDLQRQVARALYDIRHSFSHEVFASPAILGQLIAARSWTESSRFQNLAQEADLVGQIATALLFEGESGTERLIYPPTLRRIGQDLDRERRRREWMLAARHSAQERINVCGLARDSGPTSRPRRTEEARAEVAALGIEARLVLQPVDVGGTSWRVSVEIPDLSSLSRRFPNVREVLSESRCVVAGYEGRPIARARFLYGAQKLVLSSWPEHDEVFLKFDQSHPDLEFLLRTECLLRPGPPWLFRIASDGLAYECRGLRVRPGQRYIVLTTANVPASADVVRPADVQCHGIDGVLLDLPSGLSSRLEQVIQDLGLAQSRSIEVWPAGLAAVLWDGEGHGEWIADERPTLGVESDHPLSMIRVSLDGQPDSMLKLTGVTPGKPLFLELPPLPVGLHTIRVEATGTETRDAEDLGHLRVAMRVREARTWHHGVSPAGPLAVRVDPVVPTLEQLWDGQVQVEILGPHGRTVKCAISLLERGKENPTAHDTRRLELPVTPLQWRSHFETHFRSNKGVQRKYDAAYECRVDFTAGELGAFNLWCEREFTPVRWAVGERNQNPIIRLIDDSGRAEVPQVSRFSFEKPAAEKRLDFAAEYEVRAPGGLYLARQGEFSAGVIVLPRMRSLSDLIRSPVIRSRPRSMPAVLEAVGLGCKWAAAKSSGDILSVANRRNTLQVITQHVVGLIGGEGWAKAESDFKEQRTRDLSALERAVTKRSDEASFARSLSREVADLAQASIDQRVRRLAELATEHHVLGVSQGDSAVFRAPDWMAQFALRFASSPRDAVEWAGSHQRAAIIHLMEVPVIARAARFLVVGIDDCLASRSAPDEVYAGWGWQ